MAPAIDGPRRLTFCELSCNEDVVRASCANSLKAAATALQEVKMNRTRRLLASLALAGVLVACGSSNTTGPTGGGGANGSVTVGDNFFNPSTVTITHGSSVMWTWTGSNPHSVTFDAGGPNSAVQTSGTFSRTFTSGGSFTYFCTVHGRAIMSGTVVVQ